MVSNWNVLPFERFHRAVFLSRDFPAPSTARLPEGFIPAPRETEADKSGLVKTLERRLKERIYLTVQDSEGSNWSLPTVELKKGETLLQAARRAVKEKAGGELMDLYCASNCPVAVNLRVFPDDFEKNGFYGVKTFFMRVQHDEGSVSTKSLQVTDYAWLSRSEIEEIVQKEQGPSQAKFYHYLL